jgi:hypothetical protein
MTSSETYDAVVFSSRKYTTVSNTTAKLSAIEVDLYKYSSLLFESRFNGLKVKNTLPVLISLLR